MSDFDFTRLEAGEVLVLGVATHSATSSHRRVENGIVLEDGGASTTRKSGVTNRRVIVESGEATTVVPNGQVRRAWLKRDEFMGQPRLELQAVESVAGDTVEVGIGFLEAEDESRLRALFPAAQFETSAEPEPAAPPKKKGLFGFLGFGD